MRDLFIWNTITWVYNFHKEKYLKFCHFRVQNLAEKLRDNLFSFDF